MKMINLTVPLLCVFFGLLSLGSCRSNKKPDKVIKKYYSVTDFTQIECSGYYNVKVVKGAKFSIEVVATPDDHKLLSVKNLNGILEIRYSKRTSQNYPIEVNIVMPELSGFSIAGALDKTEINGFKGEDLLVLVNGSADIKVENCNYANLELELNGEGTIDALKSNTIKATATLSGLGSILVNASELLNAEVSGTGKIKYSGSPRIKASSHGQGSIEHI